MTPKKKHISSVKKPIRKSRHSRHSVKKPIRSSRRHSMKKKPIRSSNRHSVKKPIRSSRHSMKKHIRSRSRHSMKKKHIRSSRRHSIDGKNIELNQQLTISRLKKIIKKIDTMEKKVEKIKKKNPKISSVTKNKIKSEQIKTAKISKIKFDVKMLTPNFEKINKDPIYNQSYDQHLNQSYDQHLNQSYDQNISIDNIAQYISIDNIAQYTSAFDELKPSKKYSRNNKDIRATSRRTPKSAKKVKFTPNNVPSPVQDETFGFNPKQYTGEEPQNPKTRKRLFSEVSEKKFELPDVSEDQRRFEKLFTAPEEDQSRFEKRPKYGSNAEEYSGVNAAESSGVNAAESSGVNAAESNAVNKSGNNNV